MKPYEWRNAALWLPLAVFLLGSCATTPRVDWNARVGNFTYDEAILELGPPDKSARLTEGGLVAEWMSRPRGGLTLGLGTGFYRGGLGFGVGHAVRPGPAVRILRLTFDEDGFLTGWVQTAG
jgi:hypothetical protein